MKNFVITKDLKLEELFDFKFNKKNKMPQYSIVIDIEQPNRIAEVLEELTPILLDSYPNTFFEDYPFLLFGTKYLVFSRHSKVPPTMAKHGWNKQEEFLYDTSNYSLIRIQPKHFENSFGEQELRFYFEWQAQDGTWEFFSPENLYIQEEKSPPAFLHQPLFGLDFSTTDRILDKIRPSTPSLFIEHSPLHSADTDSTEEHEIDRPLKMSRS